jgi:hypothetical protein
MGYPQTRHNSFFLGQSQAAYLWEIVWEPLVTGVYGYGNWLFTSGWSPLLWLLAIQTLVILLLALWTLAIWLLVMGIWICLLTIWLLGLTF